MKILLAFLVSFFAMASPRTVFVQLFEWTWRDIARECKTNLGPNGFSAVQVSPPHEHLIWKDSPWWERYQVVSYDINSRSGNLEEFKSMIKECAEVGIDIYVDVIINHMAGMHEGYGFSGNFFNQYNYNGIYNYNDFHHCGRNGNDDIKNYSDLYELQHCELVNLADLNTSSNKVQNTLATYMNKLLSYGAKGFRLDAAKHVSPNDIAGIISKLDSKAYIIQELITSGNDPFQISDYTKNGDVTAFAYPFIVGNAFKNDNFAALRDFTKYLPNSMDSVVFIDNHDLQRNEDRHMLLSSFMDPEKFNLAQIFMLTYPFGYPQIYSSYKFSNYDDGPPVNESLMTKDILDDQGNCIAPFICEHKFSYVNNLVTFRNKSNDSFFVSNYWSNDHDQLAFGRGSQGFVVLNNSSKKMQRTFKTQMSPGLYCNLIKPNCNQKVEVNKNKYIEITLGPYSALVIQ